MTQREQDEESLTKLLRGHYLQILTVEQTIYHGMCHEVALWDGQVILQIVNRQYKFDIDVLAEHVKILR